MTNCVCIHVIVFWFLISYPPFHSTSPCLPLISPSLFLPLPLPLSLPLSPSPPSSFPPSPPSPPSPPPTHSVSSYRCNSKVGLAPSALIRKRMVAPQLPRDDVIYESHKSIYEGLNIHKPPPRRYVRTSIVLYIMYLDIIQWLIWTPEWF